MPCRQTEAAEWISFDNQDAAIAISSRERRSTHSRSARSSRTQRIPHLAGQRIPFKPRPLSHHQLPQASGPEICVLSTKLIVSQVTILIRSALELGRRNGNLPPERYRTICDALERLLTALEHVLGHEKEQIQALAELHSEFEHWFFIGRGPYYPLALESALKFKEVSYRHAEGLPAGFFKHGTISLIDEEYFTVALLPSKLAAPRRFHATLANVKRDRRAQWTRPRVRSLTAGSRRSLEYPLLHRSTVPRAGRHRRSRPAAGWPAVRLPLRGLTRPRDDQPRASRSR